MVLFKVLLITVVSCQVLNYGRAISFPLYRPYHHMRFGEFDHDMGHRELWRHPYFRSFVMPTTTQRSLQLPTANKEYGDKLAKSKIIPNKFVVSDDELPWVEALAFCSSQGMILASPQNKLQLHKLQTFLEIYDLIPVDVSGYWLGAIFIIKNEGDAFCWILNNKKVNDDLWLPSKPSANKVENCVELKNSYDEMKLNNFYCDQRRRFICEVVHPEEYRKNDETYRVASDSSEESHHEIKKLSNEGTTSASGKKKSPIMTTTTNASRSITSHEPNTTTTSRTTTTPTTTTTSTTTQTEEYYSGSPHLRAIEDPFVEYDEYFE